MIQRARINEASLTRVYLQISAQKLAWMAISEANFLSFSKISANESGCARHNLICFWYSFYSWSMELLSIKATSCRRYHVFCARFRLNYILCAEKRLTLQQNSGTWPRIVLPPHHLQGLCWSSQYSSASDYTWPCSLLHMLPAFISLSEIIVIIVFQRWRYSVANYHNWSDWSLPGNSPNRSIFDTCVRLLPSQQAKHTTEALIFMTQWQSVKY